MAEPINLNKARKARRTADAKAEASHNRVRFGRTKAEKTVEAANADKSVRALDGHTRER